MRVIGVVDLLDGLAVHAVAGQREGYTPVQAIAGEPIEPGDTLTLARAYLDRFGLTELYAADLDAILGRRSQDALIARLTMLGAPLWLDSAVSSGQRARHALNLGAARVVVGLETLPSYDVLRDICDEVGGDRVAFSLDLKNGAPIIASFPDSAGGIESGEAADQVAARAGEAGAGTVIVIDLAPGRHGPRARPWVDQPAAPRNRGLDAGGWGWGSRRGRSPPPRRRRLRRGARRHFAP